MNRMFGVGVVFALVALLGARVALAQPAAAPDAGSPAPAAAAPPASPPADPPPTAAPALEPPRVLQPAVPIVAEADRELRGTVVLRVLVGETGEVRETEVVESLDYDLDTAAREAAARSTFSPARRDGVAIAARILMRFDFPVPPAEPAAVPIAVPGAAADGGEAPSAPGVGILPADAAPGEVRPATSPEATPAPPPAAVSEPAALEVSVAGRRSQTQRMRESSEALTVVDLTAAKRRSADMGEILARTAGVVVRRSGGIGSYVRFSLNGLYDDQIRFFLDGVPLEFAGYPFGIENVPVDLMERIEIYRGVVPVRFGTDALGGAVNLVTEARSATGATAGYELGSFGTHRLSASARYRHDTSGFVAAADGYLDIADNDYDIDVEVPDERGRLSPARVPRFHDFYRAYGGSVEAGVVDQPWAKRLLLRGFAGRYEKELQHNLVMSAPYGDVNYWASIVGATLRYTQPLSSQFEIDLLANYGYGTVNFVDDGKWVYDWFGERVRERRMPGEIDGDATDVLQWGHGIYARALLTYRPHPLHSLRFAAAPTYANRSGDERIMSSPTARDPESAKRALQTLVLGLEYESNFWAISDTPPESAVEPDRDYRVQNTILTKAYVYATDTQEVAIGGTLRSRDMNVQHFGVGDGIRLRVAPWLWFKASYEFTTRFPRPDETFGDGRLVLANLELEPEVSHNFNIGPRAELKKTRAGDFTVDTSGFYRDSDNLIVLLGNDRAYRYQNVFGAKSIGVQAEIEWTSPHRYVQLLANGSYEDTYNASDEGTFGEFEGDRIPNRPWLLASWQALLHFEELVQSRDELEPFYTGRYVHEYFRGWESQGLREFKQVVDAQLIHGVGLRYGFQADGLDLSLTLEVQNLTDAKAYDFYAVQKPGRAYFAKLIGKFE